MSTPFFNSTFSWAKKAFKSYFFIKFYIVISTVNLISSFGSILSKGHLAWSMKTVYMHWIQKKWLHGSLQGSTMIHIQIGHSESTFYCSISDPLDSSILLEPVFLFCFFPNPMLVVNFSLSIESDLFLILTVSFPLSSPGPVSSSTKFKDYILINKW